jgi:hypothetical protein
MLFKRLLLAAALFCAAPALAQQGVQFPAGTIYGNNTAAQRPGQVSTVTAILDRALGSARGSIIERGASSWGLIAPGTTGLAFIGQGAGADPVYGVVGLNGGGCNAALTASNGGILYSTATACAIFAGTATARLPLLSGASTIPVWGAYTLPASVTSGGVACFTSTTVQGSSGLLTANAIVLGGGAGVCPSPMGSLGTTTTVLHGNAGGAPTFGAIVSADLTITATNCTNQFVSAISTGGVGTCRSVNFADITSTEVASTAQYLAGTASKLVQSGTIYTAETTTTFGSTTTFDFSTFINTRVTLTANITTQTLSNVIAGKAGHIVFKQSGAGSFTTVWNSVFKFAAGVTPTLTTGSATAEDVLFYDCTSATFCYASLSKDMK